MLYAPSYSWFKRSLEIVTINQVPSGFIYSGNDDTAYKVKAHITGFCDLGAQDAKSRVEKHVIPGILVSDGRGNVEFRAKSFSTDFCNGLVSGQRFSKWATGDSTHPDRPTSDQGWGQAGFSAKRI